MPSPANPNELSTNTLLLFGSQALSYDEAYFERIRSNVTCDGSNRWIIDVVDDLSTYWPELCVQIPTLKAIQGENLLRRLSLWLQNADVEDEWTSRLPNIILSPLVVIGHLIQYIQNFSTPGGQLEFDRSPSKGYRPNIETLGICIGMLSAFVISTSSTRAQFSQNGTAAIRLAMVVGALVDARDAESQSISLSTTWKSEQLSLKLHQVLANTPDSYVSVTYDENRATVTTSESTAPALKRQLGEVGISTTEIGLHGRFHTTLYGDDLAALLHFCGNHSGFRLPNASKLVIPTRSNSTGQLITQGWLHEVALRDILVERCEWIKCFQMAQSTILTAEGSRAVVFGSERCIPPSIQRTTNAQVSYLQDGDEKYSPESGVREDDIAVVGMSCNVAGAQDLDQFWKILMEGKSQHREVSDERFPFETVFRPESDPNRKWYGNFIDDYDMFDHKFFKKTPREATSMDPQQRLLYQAAYQAVAQSGYFQKPAENLDTQVGCFIGLCATDYENNVAHHPPNAFSATGNLRSFVAGKISHYFGWTGPGLTIDTACSASAVAIHQACRAILTGECTAALAGGTNFISSPLWFQNLAGASFLSPTGQCKPFDAKADGYCRGEAIASVFLKKMSLAIADGDQIFGAISATAVMQNQNCTPIFVPNAPSLSDLFRNVLDKSGLDAKQVSFVEAHGTGTPVGDPAEYDSIRRVFGGRPGQALQFGSVKGLLGHTEGSSGVVSLIKVLLMINEGYIPPQPSHSVMNPGIDASPSDNMVIASQALPWQTDFRAALINNYGASGSNASLIVQQAPLLRSTTSTEPSTTPMKAPFYISGFDDRSIQAYITRLRRFLNARAAAGANIELEDLSFNLARQSNWSLETALIFSCQSMGELNERLAAFESEGSSQTIKTPAPRPTILCFGGQVSTFVGLDRQLYEKVKVLRNYLDKCDSICQSIGAGSIYPGIFQREPVEDVAKLQPMLFAMQYACAMSWIECGVTPATIIGHSFGELTALCVAGILNLKDALTMIFGRSKLIRDLWGPESGAMMAVENDREIVEGLLVESDSDATIACFNGPRSFTLAGSVASIDALAEYISSHQAYSSMKYKKLNVTNAFHSTLVDRLKPELEKVGRGLNFKEPKIALERATESANNERLTSAYAADHMRNPVYFDHAVQRLSKKYPEAIWLEAGFNSTITVMASRALNMPKTSYFQPVNVTSGQGLSQLTDITTGLWKAGLRTAFWAHSKSQTHQYAPILLPPYQFDKQRHWLEFKSPPRLGISDSAPVDRTNPEEDLPTTLFSFVGYRENSQDYPRFRINTMIDLYTNLVSQHVIARTAPICPATVQVDMAIEAIMTVQPELRNENLHPQVCNVTNQSPICINPSRSVFLNYTRIASSKHIWNFEIVSNDQKSPGETTHVTGEVRFYPPDDPQYCLEFNRYERLVNHQRCRQVLDCDDSDDVIQGRAIYRIFADVVDYGPAFTMLQKIVGRGNESAGRVVKKHSGETWLDAHLGDCFSQVGGMWVNCIANETPADMYIANGFEQWMRSPKVVKHGDSPYGDQQEWHVLAHHNRVPSGNAYMTDIFVFNASTGGLVEVILGINYAKVAHASMGRLLTRLTPGLSPARTQATEPTGISHDVQTSSGADDSGPHSATEAPKRGSGHGKSVLLSKLKAVLADITGLEPAEIADDADLVNVGIDSLMGMEMAREVETMFSCTLDQDELMTVLTLPDLLKCLQGALGESGDDESDTTADQTSGENSGSSNDTPLSSNATSVHAWDDSHTSKVENDSRKETPVNMPASIVLDAFRESKLRTDQLTEEWRISGYLSNIYPQQSKLCVQLTVEAFKELGSDIAAARAGQELQRIPFVPQHNHLQMYLYQMLEETRIVDLDGDKITRTAFPLPSKTSDAILQDLVRNYPDHAYASQLAHWTGKNFAGVLSGKADGIKLIFGQGKGRELVAGLYGDSFLNRLSYQQMIDFLDRLVTKLSGLGEGGTLRILEMGAGTGGTTKWLVPMLAKLGLPIEYIFTDLSPSLVAMARKEYKQYPFMKFFAHDIENPPPDGYFGTQHIVIASNAVHATHSLAGSTENMRKFLRQDGFIMMTEMTMTLYWVDMIFGILEGWWLFNDGRTHAISSESRWERDLHSVGYGHVDWSDGQSPEVRIQKVIIALASGPQFDRLPAASSTPGGISSISLEPRRLAVEGYVKRFSQEFRIPKYSGSLTQISGNSRNILVTGATGSLGCHLIAHLASLPTVQTVYCLNRRNKLDPDVRQIEALKTKKINLDASSLSKLKVFQTDTAKPLLGLPQDTYETIVGSVTHIIHNAWPMNGKMVVKGFEPQFEVMRNLVNLAAEASARRSVGLKVSFQLISSIATVGHYPLHKNNPNIPEERMEIESVLPNGYGDAKYVCERILDETLHTQPDLFRPMTVRLAQVAGSSISGYWNQLEHFPFLVKSAQTLRALPNFHGPLSWTPVDAMAGTLADLLLMEDQPHPFYHIDNPVRQPWQEMLPVLAEGLGIPESRIIPFKDWIQLVRGFPGSTELDNPAAMLVDFFDQDFERMSCGGVLLGTKKTLEHSATLRGVGPVGTDVVHKYIRAWKEDGFLR
ncbi:putative polyketide synthase [Hypoxylon trugodes]|uniref:putative polyketide synthase n=1 Tax=Hypoxylon trugodes TaxID=326681 RepID=UPI00219A19AE|nr:putative polyketide synthase [Hypoxylon trugodes]KAI1385804.1 putative polyketide synthase [Hypoxylon trugodes]